MNFEYTIGAVCGAVASAVLLGVYFKRKIDQVIAEQKLKLEVEVKEHQLQLKQERSELELELAKKKAEQECGLTRREDALEIREHEHARTMERLNLTEKELEQKNKALIRERQILSDSEHEAEKTRRLFRLK